MSDPAVVVEVPPKELEVELTIVYELGERGRLVASIPAMPGPLGVGLTQDEARRGVLDGLAWKLAAEPEVPPEGPSERLHVRLCVGEGSR